MAGLPVLLIIGMLPLALARTSRRAGERAPVPVVATSVALLAVVTAKLWFIVTGRI